MQSDFRIPPSGFILMVWGLEHGVILCLDGEGGSRDTPTPSLRIMHFKGRGEIPPHPTPYIEGNIRGGGIYTVVPTTSYDLLCLINIFHSLFLTMCL